ncbi:MAG TPA: argininosuccinate lyase [Planctomycetota bacterium]|nr:argininosuccinate lyase [Planctomycetota bacterium]
MSGKRMWGGRFKGRLDPRIDALNRSFAFDRRLYDEDVTASVAWARALRHAGVLDGQELQAVVRGLERVRQEFAQGSFKARDSDEDVHTAVERRLVELVGSAGEKLHTGRSRNDQVATDLCLWLRRACDEAAATLKGLAQSLLNLAKRAGVVAIPAYTHLQRAQPVLAAHHLLAYVAMLARDRERLADARKRCDALPLGSGAAVGTGFKVDRKRLAWELGFKSVTENSLDAVGSRDGAVEFLAACALLAVHLSRLGEELVLWSSAEFGFVKLSDEVATGSSLLPQKKNPDGAELARGKAGRVIGHLTALLTTLKGLPLAYNKDLQEDKEAVFDAFDTVTSVAAALSATLDGISFDAARCAAALEGFHLLAVELADYLVRKGMPFRRAHEVVGRLVTKAEAKGIDVSALPLDDLKAEAGEFGPDVRRVVTVGAALKARSAIGGTSPARVKQSLASWNRRVSGW